VSKKRLSQEVDKLFFLFPLVYLQKLPNFRRQRAVVCGG
jgi:hypothetical protein